MRVTEILTFRAVKSKLYQDWCLDCAKALHKTELKDKFTPNQCSAMLNARSKMMKNYLGEASTEDYRMNTNEHAKRSKLL